MNICDTTIPARYLPYCPPSASRCASKREHFIRLNRAGCAALAREIELEDALEYRRMDSHDAACILDAAGVPSCLHDAVWDNFVDECIETMHYAPRVAGCWSDVFSLLEFGSY